jgi:hypothetical protein
MDNHIRMDNEKYIGLKVDFGSPLFQYVIRADCKVVEVCTHVEQQMRQESELYKVLGTRKMCNLLLPSEAHLGARIA